MKISKIIELLEKVKENHGDCEVSASWVKCFLILKG